MQTEQSLIYSILEVIAVNGGSFRGRRRLHNAAYLLKRVGALGFVSVRFDYDQGGPSSREVSNAVQEAIAAGLIEENREAVGSTQDDYQYEFTSEGSEWLQSNMPERDRHLNSVVKLLRHEPNEALELSSTVTYFEQDGYSQDQSQAFDKALEMKPTLAAYQDKAERLLRHIERHHKTAALTPSHKQLPVFSPA